MGILSGPTNLRIRFGWGGIHRADPQLTVSVWTENPNSEYWERGGGLWEPLKGGSGLLSPSGVGGLLSSLSQKE